MTINSCNVLTFKLKSDMFILLFTSCYIKNGKKPIAQIAILIFADTQALPSAKPKEPFSANAPTKHSDNKTDFFRILTN